MEIHIGDRVADVTLVNKEGNRVELTIDGKPCVVDIVMAENGSCSILHDGNSYNAELIRGEGGKSYDVNMFYRSYHVDVVDTQAKYLRMKKHADERQSDKIVAPMPGKVVSIPVQPGDERRCPVEQPVEGQYLRDVAEPGHRVAAVQAVEEVVAQRVQR